MKYQTLLALIDQFQMDQCLIFVRTQLDCDLLEAFLNNSASDIYAKADPIEPRYSCTVLHGGRRAEERDHNLLAFKNCNVRFLICTDVAARGVDIQSLPYVINLTLPDKPETYIHRVGRVGRADRIGLALSIVAAEQCEEYHWYHTCNRQDRGRGCRNYELVEKGGCVIKFDEMSMLSQIEDRIDQQIPQLTAAAAFEGAQAIIQAATAARALRRQKAGMLTRASELMAFTESRVKSLSITVQALGRLEVEAELRYWTLRNKKWNSR